MLLRATLAARRVIAAAAPPPPPPSGGRAHLRPMSCIAGPPAQLWPAAASPLPSGGRAKSSMSNRPRRRKKAKAQTTAAGLPSTSAVAAGAVNVRQPTKKSLAKLAQDALADVKTPSPSSSSSGRDHAPAACAAASISSSSYPVSIPASPITASTDLDLPASSRRTRARVRSNNTSSHLYPATLSFPPAQNIALFLDLDNVLIGEIVDDIARNDLDVQLAIIDSILNACQDRGRTVIKWAYGNIYYYRDLRMPFHHRAVELKDTPPHRKFTGAADKPASSAGVGKKSSFAPPPKNSADMKMVVDAMELAFTNDSIDTYVFASGDSDFTPILAKLREMGKHTVVVSLPDRLSWRLEEYSDETLDLMELFRQRNIDPDSFRLAMKAMHVAYDMQIGLAAPMEVDGDSSGDEVDSGDAQFDGHGGSGGRNGESGHILPSKRTLRVRKRAQKLVAVTRRAARAQKAGASAAAASSRQNENVEGAVAVSDHHREWGFLPISEVRRCMDWLSGGDDGGAVPKHERLEWILSTVASEQYIDTLKLGSETLLRPAAAVPFGVDQRSRAECVRVVDDKLKTHKSLDTRTLRHPICASLIEFLCDAGPLFDQTLVNETGALRTPLDTYQLARLRGHLVGGTAQQVKQMGESRLSAKARGALARHLVDIALECGLLVLVDPHDLHAPPSGQTGGMLTGGVEGGSVYMLGHAVRGYSDFREALDAHVVRTAGSLPYLQSDAVEGQGDQVGEVGARGGGGGQTAFSRMGPQEWHSLLYGSVGGSAAPTAEDLAYMERVLARAARPVEHYTPPKRSWWERLVG